MNEMICACDLIHQNLFHSVFNGWLIERERERDRETGRERACIVRLPNRITLYSSAQSSPYDNER